MGISTEHSLKGTLTDNSLQGKLSSTSKLSGQLTIGTILKDDVAVYDGEYAVTPSATDDVTLPTAQKLMVADVYVKKIPYYDVANEKGGSTVYIGSEV